MIRSLRVLVVLLLALFLSASSGEAAGRAKKRAQGKTLGASKEEPIVITSDRMELDQRKNTVTYRGHVVVVRGEMTMRSQALTVVYDPEMKRLKEVVAQGKVQVTQGGRVATGTKSVFNSVDNTITLTGNPAMRQGKSRVSGSRIILFVNEDRGVVEGGNKRVKAVIFPDEMGR